MFYEFITIAFYQTNIANVVLYLPSAHLFDNKRANYSENQKHSSIWFSGCRRKTRIFKKVYDLRQD